MRFLCVVCLPAFLAATTHAIAQENGAVTGAGLVPAPRATLVPGALSLGGVAERPTLRESGRFSMGVAPFGPALPSHVDSGADGLRMGGYLAWNGGDYRLDVNFLPLGIDGFVAGMSARTGAVRGEEGTSYGVRLGIVGESFSVSPANRFGVVGDYGDGNPDLNLTVTVNHAFTPSFSVVGTAEARQGSPTQMDGNGGQHEILFGAGLGVRF